MKYSDYTAEDIFNTDRKNYKKICEIFFGMAKDEETKRQLEGILYNGGFDDFSINIEECRNNPILEARNRIAYANLLVTCPETFKMIKDNNITVFHGTNSNALPNIIKSGMKSGKDLTKEGVSVITGEQNLIKDVQRSFISFTNSFDLANDFGILEPDNYSFGVMIGLTDEVLKRQKRSAIGSDYPEIGIYNSIPKEDIKFIGVPPDRVEFVKRIVNDENVIVAPVNFGERFYYFEDYGEIHIDYEQVTRMIAQQKEIGQKETGMNIDEITNKAVIQRDTNDKQTVAQIDANDKQVVESKDAIDKKTFESREINELAKTRTLPGILNTYNKIKNFFVEKFKNIKNIMIGKNENDDRER